MNSRFLTEITKANLPNCKELLKVVGQLRHLDNIKEASQSANLNI